ncbi:MAG: lytic transglycosylase domain-containing protein [Erythrobacter sp.]
MKHTGLKQAAMMLGVAVAAATLGSAAIAQSGDLVARYDQGAGAYGTVPMVLSGEDRQYYRDIFAAIDREQWSLVEGLLAQRSGGVLHQAATAAYYTHANSPRVSADQVARWFEAGAHLPQSAQLARLGAKRGLAYHPPLPVEQTLIRHPSAPKRILPRTVEDGTMPAATRAAILDAIRSDNPAAAHSSLLDVDAMLSSDSRAEWRQRVAWAYYINNDDNAALQMAETVGGGSGAWVAEGDWVAGLAAWRLGHCSLSGEAFARAAARASNPELAAAANYWAHRALVRCREPGKAQGFLAAASRYDETLYGMLAADQLGVSLPASAAAARLGRDDWAQLSVRPNIQIAAALAEIGRPDMADEVLRHEAKIGPAGNYPALTRLARELGLPGAQLFLAHNAPQGMRPDQALRFPVARWQPVTGWKVDPALAFAHALQESNFRANAVSPANARGLMQIMPGTARDHSGRLNLGASYADLNDPEVNLAYGQRHLEMLRDHPATAGHLPKIMAAYNAGLSPIGRWSYEVRDQGDPLLWMESIPYWETRGYVAIVMRNYWMYERANGALSPSRRALAQGQWPTFPQGTAQRSLALIP